MLVYLELISYGRGGAFRRVIAEEAEEVGGRHKGSVQNKELDLGTGEKKNSY